MEHGSARVGAWMYTNCRSAKPEKKKKPFALMQSKSKTWYWIKIFTSLYLLLSLTNAIKILSRENVQVRFKSTGALPVTKTSPFSRKSSIAWLLKFFGRFCRDRTIFLVCLTLLWCPKLHSSGISCASRWSKRTRAGKEFDDTGWEKWAGQWCENSIPFRCSVVFVVSPTGAARYDFCGSGPTAPPINVLLIPENRFFEYGKVKKE